MKLDILSSNIKLYRSMKRLTQAELSRLSGVSLPTIKNIERKKALPRTNTLMALSKALDCKLHDLVRPVGELSLVRFRPSRKLNRREQILTQVSTWLNNFTFLEELLSDKKEYTLSSLAQNSNGYSPIQYAEIARKVLLLKADEPIDDICGLLEHCGIKILLLSYASDSFNGLSVNDNKKGPAIVVNTWERISIERQIFSTAHELGHLLMHLFDYDGSSRPEDAIQEMEADLFAGYFLMPEQGFNTEWEDTAGLPFVDRIMKIKSIFKVSYKTVLYRLKQKGIVDDQIWLRFQKLYEIRYNKKLAYKEEPSPEGSEPFGLAPFEFHAGRLSRLVRRAVQEEKISLPRAAEILNLTSENMIERIAEWEELA